MAEKSDILVEIPTADLPLLVDLYRRPNVIEKSRHIVNTILTSLPWKESPKHRDEVKFYSPNNSWRINGTIVIIFSCGCYEIVIYTLEDSCETLCNALKETNRIDYSKDALFCSVHEDHFPKMMKALQERNVKNIFPDLPDGLPAVSFSIDPEVAKNWTIDCPEEVYIAKLTESHAEKINGDWPHKCEGSEDMIRAILELNSGWGVFLKSNNELVSWLLVHRFGLGMLQTDAKHKRKGYGCLVLKAVTKEMAFQGLYPIGNVRGVNVASINLFKSLGFEKRCCVLFIGINNSR